MRLTKVFFAVLLTAASSSVSANKQLGSIFADFEKSSPGCSVATANKGKVSFSQGYGRANLENDIAITKGTRFNAGSISKQFTAAAIAMLILDGELSPDNTIRTFFPELPPYADEITVQQLVTHTSGLRDYLTLMILAGRDLQNTISKEEVLDLIARQNSTNFKPGTAYLYSNTGYFLLGELVSRITDSSLQAFVKQRIFDPFGMTHSHFHENGMALVPDRAEDYVKIEGEWQNVRSRFAQVGSGGLFTTTGDLLKWIAALTNDKQKPLAKLMFKRGKLKSGKELSYAYGLVYGEHSGLTTVGHAGVVGGYRAHLMSYPEQDFSIALLCNRDTANTNVLISKIAKAALTGQFVPNEQISNIEEVEVDVSLLDDYVGEYSLAPRFSIEISKVGTRLFAQATGQSKNEVYPESDTSFFYKVVNAKIEFSRAPSGFVTKLVLHQNGRDLVGTRTLENTHSRPLEDYVGTYFNEEVNASVKLYLQNGSLWSRIRYNPPQQLKSLGEDRFRVGAASFQALVDSRGHVNELVVDAGRVFGIRFEKQ